MKTNTENCGNSIAEKNMSLRWHFDERGSALVMVMGTLAICVVMISHAVMLSEIITREARQSLGKDALRYQAESASEVAFWMNMNDRRLFSNRSLGQIGDDAVRESADFPPWMLDGRPHEFDDGTCIVYMQSAENGFVLTNPESLKQNFAVDDVDGQELAENFIDIMLDYTDEDDFTQLNGMEHNDYAGNGFYTLPRNGAMQFGAEVYWLPGWRTAILGEIRPLPPRNVAYTSSDSSQTSFYAASTQDLIAQLDISEQELRELLDARQRWQENGESIEDILPIELLTKIKGKFNFNEANVGAFYAMAYDNSFQIHLEYRVIREAQITSASFFADDAKQTLSIWERYAR